MYIIDTPKSTLTPRIKYIMKYIVICIVFLGASMFFVSCSRAKESKVIEVVKGPFYIKIHAVGQLKSTASLYIRPPAVNRMWQYTISFMAPEGKEVKPGDTILEFDAQSLMQRLMVKNSELQTALNELKRLQLVEQEQKENLILQLEEIKVLKEKAIMKAQQPEDLIPSNEMKKLKMDAELAVLNVQLGESRVKNQTVGMGTRLNAQQNTIKRLQTEQADLQESIARMRVRAPKAGMVVYAIDWDEKKSAVGDTVWMGQTIMELPDLKQMAVAAVIPEQEAGKIKPGMTVEVRLDSNPDRIYKGKLESLGRIFRTKSSDQPAVVFDADVKIFDPDPELMRPGMAASVDIIISSKKNILQVPESAVLYGEEGPFVWKKSLTGKKAAPVSLGVRSGGMVEVLSGVSEKDPLIISGEEGGRR
jgi:HlyD family secretion protein